MKEHDIKETALLLRDEMAKATKLTSDVSLHTVFLSAETIISCLSYLISPIAEMEQRYRLIVVTKMTEPDMSHARAEAYAKSTDEYKEWRKYSALYDLGHEQLMLLKKFRNDLAMEKSNS